MLDVSHCKGCRDDFYNGKNDVGVEVCWRREGAELVDRIRVGVWQRPPYDLTAVEKVPGCYRPKGEVMVSLNSLNKDGYWKS